MAALLEAAATGRLWSEQGGRTGMSLELQDIEDDLAEQSSSTARKVVRVICDVKSSQSSANNEFLKAVKFYRF